jgi:glycosyltransferase involved in cell wall biosynthesis
MLVSVVVPNHGRDLTVLKASLPKDVELIVVDEGKERSEQRNIGIDRATGKYLLILDSDQSVSPGLIDECVTLMRAGYSCLFIPEIIVAKSWFGKLRAFERTFYTSTAIDVPRFVRADHCPKFDTSMSGPEDADWGNRIKGFRGTTTRPLFHHDDVPIGEYFRKKAYYSKSMKRYAEKWPHDPCINLKYRCWDVFVQNGKYKQLLKHPVFALGIIALLIGRAIVWLRHR